VDNALLYSDGLVTLAASTGAAGELVLHLRGSAGLASPRRGSGIGLSVVQLLIEAMGGRVQVADNPGGGADVQLLLAGVRAGAGEATRENTEAVGGGTGVLC
jgi:hypothetical protein